MHYVSTEMYNIPISLNDIFLLSSLLAPWIHIYQLNPGLKKIDPALFIFHILEFLVYY